MRTLSALIVLSLFSILPLSAQFQYTSVPRSGEGRHLRASNATFWVNPIFLKPSIFFSSSAISVRPNRKWWRANAAFYPVNNSMLTVSVLDNEKEESAFTGFITAHNLPLDTFTSRLLRYEMIFLEKYNKNEGKTKFVLPQI